MPGVSTQLWGLETLGSTAIATKLLSVLILPHMTPKPHRDYVITHQAAVPHSVLWKRSPKSALWNWVSGVVWTIVNLDSEADLVVPFLKTIV